jgi:cytochrome P450
MVSEPAAVKALLQADPATVRAGEAGVTPLALDGDEHLAVRRMLLPPLHGEALRGHMPALREIARAEVATWRSGEPVDLHRRIEAMAREGIVQVVLGASEPGRLAHIRRLMARALVPGSSPLATLLLRRRLLGPLSPPARRLRTLNEVSALVSAEMADRVARGFAGHDVLGALMADRGADPGLVEPLRATLVAGYPTTAAGAVWTIEQLLRAPEAYARVQAELAAGDDSYLDAAIMESLRRRPPTPLVARRLAEETDIAGRDVPAGTIVAPCIYLLHHEPDLYEAPDEFRPERFLGRQPGTYSWIPFGGGIRRCVGASYALAEMKAIVREVLARGQLTPVEGRPARVRREGMSLVPAGGTRVVVH